MGGELFTRVLSEKDLSPEARHWNGNDATQRNHHGLVPFNESPLEIVLHWKSSKTAPPSVIGCYRLDLTNLQMAGYISAPRNGKVRLRFYHDHDDCIYIEPLAVPRRRLLIGKYEE
jgi:hypothetical protein